MSTPERFDDEELRALLDDVDRPWPCDASLKPAAVLVPLVRRAGVDCVVYTLRRHDLTDHAGQVAFPGGRREGEESVLACALRETEEEIAVPPGEVVPLGRLRHRVSIAGYRVSPVVARVAETAVLRADPSEVADVFEVPLPVLLDRANWTFQGIQTARRNYPYVPYVAGAPHTIWGLTAVMTRDLLKRTHGFDPQPE